MPKKITKQLELPLVEALRNLGVGNLFSHDQSSFQTPIYVKANLVHQLRPYQEEALFNFNWTQKQPQADQLYNRLLFHMATGSGKTDEMAALMLYLYTEFQYQDFLFTVSTNAVVEKTKENLLNQSSPKYLFNSPISINSQRITIESVSHFPANPDPTIIYLRLATIQTLANEVNSPKENGLTIDELAKTKLVILADEAHHFSADTKSKEAKNDHAWENVLDRIRQANPKNRQLEFTATIDLQNPAIYNKYAKQIVFQYDLSQFISEGYSKRVFRLQANTDDHNKMLDAILLSQYRKHIARDHQIEDFKPVILFKSNKIGMSNQARTDFIALINELNVEKLENYLTEHASSTHSQALKHTYAYFLKSSPTELVSELKIDFRAENTINVNDTAKDGILGDLNDLRNLNTLEEANNPFRVIFAVAKLSEGWDVLNLFDIVRIGEQPVTLNQTNAEAQLIGRGARYYPFKYENASSFTRRFDNSDSDLEILEELHYHTINQPKYLGNLKKSLDQMKLQVEDDSDFDAYSTEVKTSFKVTQAYRFGQLFYNQVEEVPLSEFDSLSSYGVQVADTSEVDLTDSVIENNIYSKTFPYVYGLSTHTIPVPLYVDHDDRLIKKALARNPFFHFDQLSHYLPTLKSMTDFIYDANWLGKVRLTARVEANVQSLTRVQQLKAVEQYLANIQKQILINFKHTRGTNKFIGLPIKDLVKGYVKHVPTQFAGTSVHELIQPYPMDQQKWFVYDQAIVDGLEKGLIDLIGNFVDQLQAKYQEVYLIRNDERNTQLRLHQFQDPVTHFQGFMPDFVLYLSDQDFIYQFYIEPKGPQLIDSDGWKQDLLTSIKPENIELVGETDSVQLYGLKFYRSGDHNQIEQSIKDISLKNK
ncbi:MAG: DEAD/DEAH box helicase family protein [Oenococcus oeni]